MSEPRWTVDTGATGVPSLRYQDVAGEGCFIFPEDIPVGYLSRASKAEAHAALVQCVRDADTLRKARDLASRYTSERYPDTGAKLGDLQALFDVLGVD